MKQGIPVHDTMESIGILCDEDNYLAVFFFVVARGGIKELEDHDESSLPP
jgi:hypothetical protein